MGLLPKPSLTKKRSVMPDLKPCLEALLFGADGPLRCERLAEVLDVERSAVFAALRALAAEYDAQGRGFYLEEVAGAYQLRTRPEYADYLRRLGRTRVFKFSRPALETLAIIAYRQPVTRVEIEYLRGVDSGSVLKTLLDKHLVRILGRKDVPGKPSIYGTSREFLELFGLPDLAALPTLKEFSELAADAEADEGAAVLLEGESHG